MPALARPPPWSSFAQKTRDLVHRMLSLGPIRKTKKISALAARQLSDNDIPWHNNPVITPLASGGTPWYRTTKFWAIAGVILAIIIILGAVCAGGASSGNPSQEADYSDSESDGTLRAWRKKKRQDARNREVDLAEWEAYERARENEIEAKLEAVQDTTRKEIRNKARAREQGLYNTEW